MSTDREIDVLIVEDNPADADLACRALKSRNIMHRRRVLVARDGSEAIHLLFPESDGQDKGVEASPKVIFLDLKLPKVGGLEVLRRLKGDNRTKPIPVVVFSSSREESDVAESYRLGANSYIVKPVVAEEYSRAVDELASYWLSLNQLPDR